MDIEKFEEKLNETISDVVVDIYNEKNILDNAFDYVTNKLNDVSNDWDAERQQSYKERIIEIISDATRQLNNVANRMK